MKCLKCSLSESRHGCRWARLVKALSSSLLGGSFLTFCDVLLIPHNISDPLAGVLRCSCMLYFDRILITWLYQTGPTKRGMVGRLTTSYRHTQILLSVCDTVSQCWSGCLEVCIVISVSLLRSSISVSSLEQQRCSCYKLLLLLYLILD